MKKRIYSFIVSIALASAVGGQELTDPGKDGAGGASRKSSVIAKTADDSPAFPYDGGSVRYLVNKEETGSQFSLVEVTEPAGYKTPLHRHTDVDEAFFVIEGNLAAKIGDRGPQVFGPGSFVLIPRGTVHAQGNLGKTPVKILVMTLPGGFERFFADRVELFKKVKPGDPAFEDRIKEVITRNHIEVLGPWNP